MDESLDKSLEESSKKIKIKKILDTISRKNLKKNAWRNPLNYSWNYDSENF